MTDGLLGGYQVDQNVVALLQVVAALVQAIAAIVIIYVTMRAARAGAERAYELSQKQALAQEQRAQAEQQKQLEEQISSVRLLLHLEIRQNLKDLKWLRDNLVEILGEDDERHYRQAGASDVESYRWLDARRHFISSYLPDWGHRFWHSQQSSHLLPIALKEVEIRQVNYIHSQLDRLANIKDMLNERARQHALGGEHDVLDNDGRGLMPPASFREDAPRLWAEFTDTLNRILEMGNPLADAAEERDAQRLSADAERIGTPPHARQLEAASGGASKQP